MSRSRIDVRDVRARGRWAHIVGLASLALAAQGSSCSLDGRAVGLAPDAGAGGSSGAGQGGAETNAGSGGSSQSPSEMGGSSGAAGSAGSGGGSQDSGPVPPVLAACADEFFGEGAARQVTTTSDMGDFTLSCAPGVSDDVAYHWIAPAPGFYAFDTIGSTFDTGLALLSPNCEQELVCDDDGRAPQSELLRRFASGEEAIVVVDGKSGSFGDAVVNISAITCPAIDADRQPLPLASTTSDGSNDHDGACGGSGLREKAFRYEAAEAGLHRFSVSSDVISPVLYVESGARCGGVLRGCNAGLDTTNPAVVVRRLEQGEVVTLIVDSANGAGTFDLDVERLAGATCPNQAPITSSFDVTATLAPGDPSVLTGSCVPERQVVMPGGTYPLPDHVYPVALPAGYGCFLSFNASGPLAVSVLSGSSCAGSELVCQVIDSFGTEVDIEVDLGDAFAGTPSNYDIVVESASPVQGPVTYTMTLGCFIT